MLNLPIAASRRQRFVRLASSIFFLVLSAALLAGSARAETITVPAGGDLQAALNAARPGDTIVLEAGAQFLGPITLPNKQTSSTDWITIRTSTPDSSLPSAATRVSPSDSPLLPKIVSPGLGEPALRTAPGAHHYRLVGVEIRTLEPSSQVYDLVKLGDSSSAQDSLDEVPHHLVLDRCLITAFPTQTLKRGVALHSRDTEIRNCHIAGFKSQDQDAQAIGGWNGPGPFVIENNYLEASGENIMFGGAAPAIAGLVPSDITVRRNHLYKPLSWKPGEPEYAGTKWVVKNSFELKSARRVLFEGNVIENCWGGGLGYGAINLTVRGDSGPQATLEDVTVRHNVIKHTGNGLNVLGKDTVMPSQQGHGLKIENNLFVDVDGPRWGDGGGEFIKIGYMRDVTIDHNTVLQTGSAVIVYGAQVSDFVFTNNIVRHNTYGIIGQDQGSGSSTIDAYFPGGVIRRNVIAGGSDGYPNYYPADNFYPSLLDQVIFNNPSAGDYSLAPGSPYKSQATDGKDVGFDREALEAAAESGSDDSDPTPDPDPTPGPFKGAPAALPGTIEAEDFDNGSEGAAYHDSDPTNNGGQYRTTGVDVRTAAAGNGFAVFNAVAGEWMTYTVSVAAGGDYDLSVRVASRNAGGTFHVLLNGRDVTGAMQVPATGAWQTFQSVTKRGVRLSQGVHVLRLSMDSNGADTVVADFDALVVTPSLRTPGLVSDALTAASSLTAGSTPTASKIAALVAKIEQAHAAFLSEAAYVPSSDSVDKGLRAALYFSRASYALDAVEDSSSTVLARLQVAASYLGQVKALLNPAGADAASAAFTAHGSAAAAAPVIGPADTRSSATFAAVLAPESLGTIIGDPAQSPLSTQTAAAAATAGGKLPYELAGVSVMVNGRAAQVLSVSPARVSFVVPAGLAAGDAEVIVTLQEGYVSRGTVTIAAAAPGIFTRGENGAGEAIAVAANSLAVGPFDVTANVLGQDKRTRLILFGTGVCNSLTNFDTSNDPVLPGAAANLAEGVKVEARTADGRVFNLAVEYAGAWGEYPGLEQITVVLPAELKGAGAVELTVVTGALRSNAATVRVK